MTNGEFIAILDEGRFKAACAELLVSLDPSIAMRIGEQLACRDPSQWDVLTGVFFRILLEYVALGFPLAFPREMVSVYLEAGDKLETPLFQCELCGYCVPRSIRACPLCGGRTGFGVYVSRRARKAGSN